MGRATPLRVPCTVLQLPGHPSAISRRTPIAILPIANTALTARRPFHGAVAALWDEGVRVLLGSGQWTPHPPGTGGDHLANLPLARGPDRREPGPGLNPAIRMERQWDQANREDAAHSGDSRPRHPDRSRGPRPAASPAVGM
jgi:hypothetical protein